MKLIRPLTVLLMCLGAALLFFRQTVFSGFEIIPGDIGDGSLIMGFTDHWRMVFSGQQAWDTLPMFWPMKGTLGYSDTFFLHGIIHSALCATGLDIYISYSITLIVFAATGCALMYLLLARFFKLHWLLAAALAVVFVNLSATAAITTHFQLTLIWLCPGLLMLLIKTIEGGQKAILWGAASGAMLALMFFTAFYIPWFFCVYGGICLMIWILNGFISSYVRCEGRETISIGLRLKTGTLHSRIKFLFSSWKRAVVFGLVFAICAIPFFVLYLPALKESGGFGYDGMIKVLPRAADFLNVESSLYLWGWVMDALNIKVPAHTGELHFGATPILLISFLSSFVYLWFKHHKGEAMERMEQTALLFAGAVLVCWLLLLKINDTSLWYIVYKLVPGASAVRAVFRFNVVLSFFALLAIAVSLKSFLQKRTIARTALACLFVSLLLIEQIHNYDSSYNIKRSQMKAFMDAIPEPPCDARLFYIKSVNNSPVWLQICAFRIAQHLNMDTVNGYSGVHPRGWSLRDPKDRSYEERIGDWVEYETIDGFYALDIDKMSWSKADTTTRRNTYKLGTDLIASRSFPDGRNGWSGLESWGVWSNADKTKIALTLDKPLMQTAQLELALRSFTPKKHPVQRVNIKVNEIHMANFEMNYATSKNTYSFTLPDACIGERTLIFTFELPDAASPAKIGAGTDRRMLGIGVERFVLIGEAE